jgi:hypothetical protein
MAVGSTSAPVAELEHLITAGRLPSTAAAFLHRQRIRFFVFHRLLHLGSGVAWSRSSGINGSGS